jgi:hypothetical protein
MPALDADHGGDLALPRDPFDVVRGAGELESIRIRSEQPEERVHLLEGLDDGLVGGQVRGHVDRPELAPQSALFEAWEIRVEPRARLPHVGLGVVLLARLPERPE